MWSGKKLFDMPEKMGIGCTKLFTKGQTAGFSADFKTLLCFQFVKFKSTFITGGYVSLIKE